MRKFLYALPLLAALPLAGLYAAHHETTGGAMPHAMPAVDVSKVTGGAYTVDNHHAQVQWQVNHLGFNDYFGLFGQITGTLNLDKANPSASKVKVTIPMSDLVTSRGDLTKHMMSADFLDATKHPTATFESTSIKVDGQKAMITGNLTLLGVTKPVVLDAHLSGAGSNMMNKKETVGFHAKTSIKRSEWGMTKFIPGITDEVKLKISIAFEK
jgi:polyisoprenoid-binding protein YceI